ncbi:MAG: PfkB family carbohydrate kinase [Candidatus Nitrosopumilus limneticus]|nr:Ribokinase [Candidatus Nitrosopumilus limneticus]MSS86578.1 ribokinase [Nitrosopumilus sp.]PHY03731.1 MAG: ribokinase [Nitrososphaerota archaeon]MDC4212764.1 PfkB family carbohydrate kinase [Candidatus Nitrosopumilus limneticus]MDC4213316.1 PfkB family carbohydrate kinase [Candidatus Nitrosopumilus limneticus]
MKIAIFSHCALDTITIDGNSYEQIGGAASYCGIMARELKFDVDLFTKFGPDFPKQYLTKNKINLINSESSKNTTKFSISLSGSDRTLKLQNECDPIDYSNVNADGHLVSPIFHEISDNVFKKIKDDSNFLFVDPQGFLRQKDSENNIILKKTELDLSDVNAIKINPEEGKNIVDGTSDEMMLALQKKGIEYVIFTDKTNVSLLIKNRIYSLKLPNKTVHDTTGIGDIFCSTFTCTMLKEKDFLWALCFAAGSAQAALESNDVGLQKIPTKGAVENNASYFYNLVDFRDL